MDSSTQLNGANTPSKTKTILLAEDDRPTQTLFGAALRSLPDYQVIIVNNGLEALEVLKKQEVSVLVTDLHMPVMDGFELISIIYERYPHVPVLVMTGLAETSHQNAPMFLGALGILPKPVKLSELTAKIIDAGNRRPDGIIKGIPLTALLQLMEWERKSCTVTVKSEQGIGILYIQDGSLIHANFMEMEGLPAAYKILALSVPQIEFTAVCRVHRTIKAPLTELLLNAAMNKDIEGAG